MKCSIFILSSYSPRFRVWDESLLKNAGYKIARYDNLEELQADPGIFESHLVIAEVEVQADAERIHLLYGWHESYYLQSIARLIFLTSTGELGVLHKLQQIRTSEIIHFPIVPKSFVFKVGLQERLLKPKENLVLEKKSGSDFSVSFKPIDERKKMVILTGPTAGSGKWQEHGLTPQGKTRWRWIKPVQKKNDAEPGAEIGPQWELQSAVEAIYDEAAENWNVEDEEAELLYMQQDKVLFSATKAAKLLEKNKAVEGSPVFHEVDETEKEEKRQKETIEVEPKQSVVQRESASPTKKDENLKKENMKSAPLPERKLEAQIWQGKVEPLKAHKNLQQEAEKNELDNNKLASSAEIKTESKKTESSSPAQETKIAPSAESKIDKKPSLKKAAKENELGSQTKESTFVSRIMRALLVGKKNRAIISVHNLAEAKRADWNQAKEISKKTDLKSSPAAAAIESNAPSPITTQLEDTNSLQKKSAANAASKQQSYPASVSDKTDNYATPDNPKGAGKESESKEQESPQKKNLAEIDSQEKVLLEELDEKILQLESELEASEIKIENLEPAIDPDSPSVPEVLEENTVPATSKVAKIENRFAQEEAAKQELSKVKQEKFYDYEKKTIISKEHHIPKDDDAKERSTYGRLFYTKSLAELSDNNSSWERIDQYRIYLSAEHKYQGAYTLQDLLPVWIYIGELAPDFLEHHSAWKFYDREPVLHTSLDELPTPVVQLLSSYAKNSTAAEELNASAESIPISTSKLESTEDRAASNAEAIQASNFSPLAEVRKKGFFAWLRSLIGL